MFCEKCGSELKENARFCEKCGAPVKIPEGQENAQNAAGAAPAGSAAGSAAGASASAAAGASIPKVDAGKIMEQISCLPKKTLGIIGGAAVAVIVLLVLIFGRGKTVKLTPYVSVEFSGVNNYGSADYTFDEDAFRKKYDGKVKFRNTKELRELKELMGKNFDYNGYALDYLLDDCVTISVDPDEGLKNGDTVTLTFDVDEEAVKETFGCKVKFKDQTYTVEGLEEVGTTDIFEDLDIVFTGTAPYGTATVDTDKTTGMASSVNFTLDKYENLSNGDVVTVTADPLENEDEFMKNCAEQYGAVPESMTKEYTVEGLPTYITKIEDIPEDMMDKMKAQAEDVFNAESAKWKAGASVESVTYIGSYMMTKKKGDSWGDNAKIYLVYNIGAMEQNEDMGVENHFNYYYTVGFDDITKLPDGTSTMDLTDYTVPYSSFRRDVEWNVGWFEHYYTYTGYETIDNLFNDCIGKYVDQYNYESTVEDVASDAAPAEDVQEESDSEE